MIKEKFEITTEMVEEYNKNILRLQEDSRRRRRLFESYFWPDLVPQRFARTRLFWGRIVYAAKDFLNPDKGE